MIATSTDCRLRRIEDLLPGDHCCWLFQNDTSHRKVVKPFILNGLEREEAVIYLADSYSPKVILEYLRDEDSENRLVQHSLENGGLKILRAEGLYVREGYFDPEATICFLEREIRQVLDEGHSAIRIMEEMTWVLGANFGSDRLIEYEVRLDKFASNNKCQVICQYDRRVFSSVQLMEALLTHPIALVETNIYENPLYIPPHYMLGSTRNDAELERWLQNMAERKYLEEQCDRVRYLLQVSLETLPNDTYFKNRKSPFEKIWTAPSNHAERPRPSEDTEEKEPESLRTIST